MNYGVKPGYKRLAMDLPEEGHALIKRIALDHRIPIRTYLLRIIMKQVVIDAELLGIPVDVNKI